MKYKRLTFKELKTWSSFQEHCEFIEIKNDKVALALHLQTGLRTPISKRNRTHWYMLADVTHPYNTKIINGKVLNKRTIMVCKPELVQDNREW